MTKTNINISTIKINTIDKSGRTSFNSTMQMGNNVINKRVEAFGEQNADDVFIVKPTLYTEDSDFIDSNSFKKN